MLNAQVRPVTGPYRGRFAPSPSGPLHAGSLIAALASYLDAKANNGLWYVRMEDLDPPRETPQAATQILTTLDKLGLHWDDEVMYQSNRSDAYEHAINALSSQNLLFPCTCTRQQVQANGGVYPGTCRSVPVSKTTLTSLPSPYALRCRVDSFETTFEDLLQGRQQHPLEQTGDFVIKRKDGLYAYQLAVVVDDAQQNISHIIRGVDLLDSTPKQIYLQAMLGLPTPSYGHIPVIVNDQGQKLSKQHFAQAADTKSPEAALITALHYLRQNPGPELNDCHREDILTWAIAHWNTSSLHQLQQLPQKI